MGFNESAVFVLVFLGLWWMPVFGVVRSGGVRCVWVCTCCSCMLALALVVSSRGHPEVQVMTCYRLVSTAATRYIGHSLRRVTCMLASARWCRPKRAGDSESMFVYVSFGVLSLNSLPLLSFALPCYANACSTAPSSTTCVFVVLLPLSLFLHPRRLRGADSLASADPTRQAVVWHEQHHVCRQALRALSF